MLKPWIYDRSPLEGIVFEEALQSLKKDIAVIIYSYSLSLSPLYFLKLPFLA